MFHPYNGMVTEPTEVNMRLAAKRKMSLSWLHDEKEDCLGRNH
jgi:hypothetical protein